MDINGLPVRLQQMRTPNHSIWRYLPYVHERLHLFPTAIIQKNGQTVKQLQQADSDIAII